MKYIAKYTLDDLYEVLDDLEKQRREITKEYENEINEVQKYFIKKDLERENMLIFEIKKRIEMKQTE